MYLFHTGLMYLFHSFSAAPGGCSEGSAGTAGEVNRMLEELSGSLAHDKGYYHS